MIKTKRTKYRYIIVTEMISSATKHKVYSLLNYRFNSLEIFNLELKYGLVNGRYFVRVSRNFVHLVKSLLQLVNVNTILIVHSL